VHRAGGAGVQMTEAAACVAGAADGGGQ